MAEHPEYDDYWKQWAIAAVRRDPRAGADGGGVVRHLPGWIAAELHGHARSPVTEEARNGQRLLVVIGGHAGIGRKIGAVDFGDAAAEFDEGNVTLAWYDYILQGKQNEFAQPDRVKLFVMGDNKWRWEKDWPLERAKETKYYLHSDGKANSAAGDGKLSLTEIGTKTADAFVYDPAKPVPTTGGPLCCGPFNGMLGPQNQSTVEERKDVLVYTTGPLDHDVEVTGPVKLVLYAKSSAVDTDFTGKLVDVGPDGFAKNLTEGILRGRYRESTLGPAKLMKPGEVYKFEIDLWATSNVFKQGHEIRLEVSSSNFPRFDRNLNTGKTRARARRW